MRPGNIRTAVLLALSIFAASSLAHAQQSGNSAVRDPGLRPQAPPAAPIPIGCVPTHYLKETPYCAETEQRGRASACACARIQYSRLV
jgi:hypothetical protein